MAGCVPCFVIPLLLFIFHRYIQPILLKFWNPWETKPVEPPPEFPGFACPIKKKPVKKEELNDTTEKLIDTENSGNNCKIKSN